MANISIIASVVSVILAFIAIWQALYFYTKAKDTENRVEGALVGIKTQVETLQSVNSRITDRLTRYVTTPRNDSVQTAEYFAATLRSLPDIALKLIPPTQANNDSALRKEVMLSYVALWYYAAATNLSASFTLPRPEDFDPDRHTYIKLALDQSAADFKNLSTLVSQLDQQELRSPTFELAKYYRDVMDILGPLVGDTSEHFARSSKQPT